MTEMIKSLPPLTRYWGGGILLCGLLITLGLINPMGIYFEPYAILRGEVWRLLTAPFFVGKLDFHLLLFILIDFRFFKALEETKLNGRLSTVVFTFILVWVLSIALSYILGSYLLARSMVAAFTYIYAKLSPAQIIYLMMVIPIDIRWLPVGLIAIQILSGQPWWQLVVGYLAGHIVFYLLWLLPVKLKRSVLTVPPILERLLDEPGAGSPEQDVRPRGQGRRIGD